MELTGGINQHDTNHSLAIKYPIPMLIHMRSTVPPISYASFRCKQRYIHLSSLYQMQRLRRPDLQHR